MVERGGLTGKLFVNNRRLSQQQNELAIFAVKKILLQRG